MLLSRILAWCTVIFCAIDVLRIVARLSRVKSLNRFFHKLHIPFGVLAIIAGGLHGLLAGNFPDASVAEIEFAPLLLTLNWGTGVYLCILLLGMTYLLRKRLKRKWMTAHRVLTLILLVGLALHLLDVGIALPNALFPAKPDDKPIITDVSPAPSPDVSDEPTSAPSPPDAPTPDAPSSPDPEPAVTEPATTEPVPVAPPITFSGAVLSDGVYEGSAQGRNGPIYVSVTVEGGSVSDLSVTSHSETTKYFSRAVGIVSDILSDQSLEVDAVSGATLSSDGIKAAVYNALQDAVISGELVIN